MPRLCRASESIVLGSLASTIDRLEAGLQRAVVVPTGAGPPSVPDLAERACLGDLRAAHDLKAAINAGAGRAFVEWALVDASEPP